MELHDGEQMQPVLQLDEEGKYEQKVGVGMMVFVKVNMMVASRAGLDGFSASSSRLARTTFIDFVGGVDSLRTTLFHQA